MASKSTKRKITSYNSTKQHIVENYKTLQVTTDFEVSLLPIMAELRTGKKKIEQHRITNYNRLTVLLVA